MNRLGHILFCLLLSTSSHAPASHEARQTLLDPAALDGLLTKVGRGVQETTNEILGLAWSETIVTEELDEQLRPTAKPKEYRYDAIVVRQKSPTNPAETRLVASRELKTVDGKRTSQSDLKAGKCRDTNPSPVYGMPLAFLLQPERSRYDFAIVGEEQSSDGRPLVVISAKLKLSVQTPSKPEASVEGGCFHLVGAPPAEGRIWVDAERAEALKVSWRQPQPIELALPAGVNRMGPLFVFRPGRQLRLERQESQTTFERVLFDTPSQMILMPRDQESLTLISGSKSPGLRVTVRYSQFKRFLTDVRVKEAQ